jgi:hypothetical protein
VAQREYAAGVDGVVSDAVVAVVERGAGGDGLGAGIVGLLRGTSAQGSVRSDGVVVSPEGIELGL